MHPLGAVAVIEITRPLPPDGATIAPRLAGAAAALMRARRQAPSDPLRIADRGAVPSAV